MAADGGNGLLLRNGYIIGEWNYNSAGASATLETQSICKSFVGMLLGKAIDKGYITSLDAKMINYPYFSGKTSSQWKNDITFRHMIAMMSGLAPTLWVTRDEPNWAPGTRYYYSTHQSWILADVLWGVWGNATGDLSNTFNNVLNTEFSQKIGASKTYFSGNLITGTDGVTFGYYLLNSQPRDLARFAYLFANRGNWNGTQVLSQSFVDATLTNFVDGTPSYRVHSGESHYGDYDYMGDDRYGYGLGWWKRMSPSNTNIWCMSGLGNQFACIWPEEKIMIIKLNGYIANPTSNWDFLGTDLAAGITQSCKE